MKIVCDRDILFESIGITMKAVSSRTTLPILECILIKSDENGVRLIGNDLEIGIETASIEAEALEFGSVAIEGKIFADIVRRMPPGDLLISSDSNNMTLIKRGKTEFNVLGQPGEEFPYPPEVSREGAFSFSIPSNILKGMIRQTIFSVAADDSKPILTGELLEIRDGMVRLVAVDASRGVALREMPIIKEGDGPDPGVRLKAIIPGKALREVAKLLPDSGSETANIYIIEKTALFELKDCVLVTRLIDGDFINYENVFTNDYTTLIYADREALLNAIERTSSITVKDVRKCPLKINVTEDKIILTMNTEMGNAYDEVNVSVEGMPITIGFNPTYLVDALRAIDEPEVCIQLTTPLYPCIIRHEEYNGYKYLIMPLRMMN